MMRKHFFCDCGWHSHGLVIEKSEHDEVDIFIIASRHDTSLKERIKSAWRVLRGSDHALSEIVLDRDSLHEFVDFVAGLAHDELT